MKGISFQKMPLIATAVVCVVLYVAAGLKFENFFSVAVFRDLLTDNSFLGIAAAGLTFVILSGGIDLSVGAVISTSSIAIAVLIQHLNWHPAMAMLLILFLGLAFGAAMGVLIHFFALPAFLVTLAGMFLMRGIGLIISTDQVSIDHPAVLQIADVGIKSGEDMILPLVAMAFILVIAICMFIAHKTVFGRTVYAIGGSEEAAVMMGLHVARTKVGVYALGGFCSALGGVVYTAYTSAGNSTAVSGLELDAIAAVVIGGTLLTGGVGYVFGTFLGVLIFGMIQTAITFQGTLTSWWTRIFIATLLLLFLALQKLIGRIGTRQH